MKTLTKSAIQDWINQRDDADLFCPDCLTPLSRDDDGKMYCGNEMCLNDEQMLDDDELDNE